MASMLNEFQTGYQRVESSLQKLIDSIAAYNPSTSAADELYSGHEAIDANLEKLVEHQQNYQRIQELRQISESLDETLKNTIRLLADTRKEIQAIPSIDRSERREVNISDLLQYAKFIAPTTVPPTFRKPLPEDLQPKPAAKAADSTEAPQITNGIATPGHDAADANAPYTKSTETTALKVMAESDKAWLKPENLPFEPWPSQGIIASGALAKIQKMLEDEIDPATVLSKEEQEAEDQRKKEREEQEKKEAAEKEQRAKASFGDYGSGRRGTVAEPFNPDDL